VLQTTTSVLQKLLHQHVEHVWGFAHPVVHLAFIVGTTIGFKNQLIKDTCGSLLSLFYVGI
jgi:hypothetical protein